MAEHVQGMPILVAHGDADWVVPVELVWYSASARSMRSIQARQKKHASTSRTCPLLRGHCLACPVKAEREGVLISLRLCQLPRVSAPLTTHGEVVMCNGTRLAALQGRKAAQECQALALHAHYVEYPGASARVIESYCFASSVCCTVCCAAACGALTVASVMSCSSCIPAVLDTCLHTLPPSPYMSLRARAHAQARHAPFTD